MEVKVSRFFEFYISWCGDEERACDEALHSGLVKNCKHLAYDFYHHCLHHKWVKPMRFEHFSVGSDG